MSFVPIQPPHHASITATEDSSLPLKRTVCVSARTSCKKL